MDQIRNISRWHGLYLAFVLLLGSCSVRGDSEDGLSTISYNYVSNDSGDSENMEVQNEEDTDSNLIFFIKEHGEEEALIKIHGSIVPKYDLNCCPNKNKWVDLKSSHDKLLEKEFGDYNNYKIKNNLHREIFELQNESRNIIEQLETREKEEIEDLKFRKKRRSFLESLFFTTHLEDLKRIRALLKSQSKDKEKIKEISKKIKFKQNKINEIDKRITTSNDIRHFLKNVEKIELIASFMSEDLTKLTGESLEKYKQSLELYKSIIEKECMHSFRKLNNSQIKLGILRSLGFMINCDDVNLGSHYASYWLKRYYRLNLDERKDIRNAILQIKNIGIELYRREDKNQRSQGIYILLSLQILLSECISKKPLNCSLLDYHNKCEDLKEKDILLIDNESEELSEEKFTRQLMNLLG